MQASVESKKFGRMFVQDIDRIAANEEEMYDFVLRGLDAEERVRLRQFIDRALDECRDETLMRLWDSVDSDIDFPTAQDLRVMLKGVRDRLR